VLHGLNLRKYRGEGGNIFAQWGDGIRIILTF